MKTANSNFPDGRSVAMFPHGSFSNAELSSPKLLPWLAARSGISFADAQNFWRQACREASQAVAPDSSDFFEHAIDRTIELIDRESTLRDVVSFGLRPWARFQASLISAGCDLIYSSYQLPHRHLRAMRTTRWVSKFNASPMYHHASPAVDFERSSK